MPNTFSPRITNPSGNTTALSTVNQAVSIINSSFSNLSSTGQQAVSNITSIQIERAGSGRSWVDVYSGTFHLNAGEVLRESASYVAGSIMHDGFHVEQFLSGLAWTGVQAEQNATDLELYNAAALGLSPVEVNSLYTYRNDPNMIQNRIEEPIFMLGGVSNLHYDDLFTFTTEYGIDFSDLTESGFDAVYALGIWPNSVDSFAQTFTYTLDGGVFF